MSPARLIRVSGYAVALLSLAYAAVLTVGLATLPSADTPIQDPWFTAMELLILAIAPVMVAFTVGVHLAVPAAHRPASLLGVIFMSMCAVLTCAVHFAVLTLSRQPALAGEAWAPLVFSFRWPSVVYAVDILAWDVFFALGALGLAGAVPPAHHDRAVRRLLLGGAALALVGLAGVPLADMRVRNIGIIGYAVLFPVAALLLARRPPSALPTPAATPPLVT